jgi:uncharacterized SAM-binding protein YcdF (DUF218 family)
MFFVLSKTAAQLLVPSNLLLAVGLAGLVLLATRWRRLGKGLALASLVLFLVIGFLPVGYTLNYILENRFPPWDASRGAPDGIIVLGGALDPRITRARGQAALYDSAERLTILAMLARDYPKARIVFTGGSDKLSANQPLESDYVMPLLESFGIARERITLERRARNTQENAAFSKALIEPKPGERWLLVTSAQHMPRAIGCFRRVGFPVEAYPVDWHTVPRWRPSFNLGFASGVAGTDGAVHEWEGLAIYWLTGRTSEFLPGP